MTKSPRGSSPNNSNPNNKLAVIEEEFVDETNKSIQSRTKLRAPSSSNVSNNSSARDRGIKNEETKRHSIITNGGLNTS